MTQEEKRIKIAGALGWKHESSGYERHGCRIESPWGVWWHLDVSGCQLSPPNYFKDLNACHEMEKALPDGMAFVYHDRLQSIGIAIGPEDGIQAYTLHSSADMRSEAFGLTFGLWKEGE